MLLPSASSLSLPPLPPMCRPCIPLSSGGSSSIGKGSAAEPALPSGCWLSAAPAAGIASGSDGCLIMGEVLVVAPAASPAAGVAAIVSAAAGNVSARGCRRLDDESYTQAMAWHEGSGAARVKPATVRAFPCKRPEYDIRGVHMRVQVTCRWAIR
jgi:hypothetical protein